MPRNLLILLLQYLCWTQANIYLYNTEDSSSLQAFDCLYHGPVQYCRRLLEPKPLQRHNDIYWCHSGGIPHSFSSLRTENVTVHTILRQWRSSLESAEQYSHYLQYNDSNDQYLCDCRGKEGSFGKFCEYSLPLETTFDKTILRKFQDNKKKLYYVGDIVCYRTLRCDYGLLCLDWRDICDGDQQCMMGLDEENCDKIEFNECEQDEFRCRNGMCIPDEYFLDGEYDCMDMSDEKEQFNDMSCPFQAPTALCDDRVGQRQRWSCGDGQYIASRLPRVLSASSNAITCHNRRDQFFWCETVEDEGLWTMENGRCSSRRTFDERNLTEYCHYLKICALTRNNRHNCSCRNQGKNCSALFQQSCSNWSVPYYPNGGLLAPYIFGHYETFFFSDNERRGWKLNGSIKCDGYSVDMRQPLELTPWHVSLEFIEPEICAPLMGVLQRNDSGYDPFCYNDSTTFNNRSYHSIDYFRTIPKCTSAYRVEQWFGLEANRRMQEICSSVQHHRFRCSEQQITCFYPDKLGDSASFCDNKYDEFWMGSEITLSRINCTSETKANCQFLRQYIEASWNSTLYNSTHLMGFSNKKIPFRIYCDTVNDFPSKEDEDGRSCQLWRCPREQVQCPSGHCIDRSWVLDGEWDCSDGSDEENLFVSNFSKINEQYSWFQMADYKQEFMNQYGQKSLWCTCNSTGYWTYYHDQRFCIDLELFEGDSFQCFPQCEESEGIKHCYQSLISLGYSSFQCVSMKTCIKYSPQPAGPCWPIPGQILNNDQCDPESTNSFKCWNGNQTAKKCNNDPECFHGEDEYLCPDGESIDDIRRNKQQFVRTRRIQLHLTPFPTSDNISESIVTTAVNTPSPPSPTNLSIFNRCNRGIPIQSLNDSHVCFCPPQYYGDQCQYHTDRLTFLTHLNFSHSRYTIDSDFAIVNKYLAVLLYNEQVIHVEEFHVRPVADLRSYRKQLTYFHYSRFPELFKLKQERFRNRSNIIDEHPYQIRVEGYEMRPRVKPERFAVWLFPIYFDFLPVYRFAQVLRFANRSKNLVDPCVPNPCSANADCYRIENEDSKHVCLCRSGYFGVNCSNSSELCQAAYCSSNSLCLPDYRGLVYGMEWPYCICPLNHIGRRCELIPNACASNPCQNNGSCYQGAGPDRWNCICTDKYVGTSCDQHKPFVRLNIVQSQMQDYRGVVVQYLTINDAMTELTLSHQSVHSILPSSLHYMHSSKTIPEIVLLRRYAAHRTEIYLLTVRMKTESLTANVFINQTNLCKDIRSENVKVFEYHLYCERNGSLECFYDEKYLCLCAENHSRVECLNYDHEFDRCGDCLANGRCLKGMKNEFLCICPACHYGRRCQLNFESFSFTVDQLFFHDLTTKNSFVRALTFGSLILFPSLLFLLGLINNLFCFATFRRYNCRRNGIGLYLYHMSIWNQVNFVFLVIRFVHLTVNIASPYSAKLIDDILCKTLHYTLTVSTRMTYWLSSLIAMERFYVVLFLNGQWLKKPSIARRMIFLTVVIIAIVSAYELAFFRSQISSDDNNNGMCVINFPRQYSAWKYLHETVTIIDSLVPFLVNLICTIGIICIVTKKKMNINAHNSDIPVVMITNVQGHDQSVTEDKRINLERRNGRRIRLNFRLLKSVLLENKELVIAPTFTLIPQLFSLPYFIASYMLQCRNFQSHPLRYLLIVSFFTAFIPQMTSFFLYISPSTFYRKEWQRTRYAKWIGSFRHSPTTVFSKSTHTEEKTKKFTD